MFGPNKATRLKYRDDLNLDMLLGIHEPNTFCVFEQLVTPGDVIADIGANVGYFSAYLSRKVGVSGRVHSFEPIPETFSRLEENLRLNQAGNVIAVNKAVGSQTGKATMHMSNSHYMASFDVGWAGAATAEVDVECVRLSDYCAETGAVFDFIKMDIEGGGPLALDGMRPIIEQQQPVLFLESHTPEEDLAIGKALSLVPYQVFRVGSSVPLKYLDRNHEDEFGVYGTVIGIPQSKQSKFPGLSPAAFQQARWGQR